MKKYITICTFLVFAFVNAQIAPPENNSEKLKGNVKSIEIKKYSAVEYFGELKKDTIQRTTFINYDNKNNVINWKKISNRRGEETGEIIYTDKINFKERKRIRNNTEIDIYQWKYDSKGNIIEYTEYSGDTLSRKQIANYDKNNKIIEFKDYYLNGKLYTKRSWKYDLKGNLIEYEDYVDGSYIKNIFKYKNGILVETLSLDEKGEKASQTNHFYNKNGVIKEDITEVYNSIFSSKIITNYNLQGKEISKKEYDTNSNISNVDVYKYDKKGNLILSDWGGHNKYIYSYDNNRNIIRREHFYINMTFTSPEEKDLTKEIVVWEFDSIGNEIKKVTSYFYNNSLIESDKKSVEERIITYR